MDDKQQLISSTQTPAQVSTQEQILAHAQAQTKVMEAMEARVNEAMKTNDTQRKKTYKDGLKEIEDSGSGIEYVCVSGLVRNCVIFGILLSVVSTVLFALIYPEYVTMTELLQAGKEAEEEDKGLAALLYIVLGGNASCFCVIIGLGLIGYYIGKRYVMLRAPRFF